MSGRLVRDKTYGTREAVEFIKSVVVIGRLNRLRIARCPAGLSS